MVTIDVVLLIIIGILLFELIVFVHEGGHFISAKLSGVKVNEFALGMGPKLIHFTKGETTYSLRLFPIGGFCSMEGEDGESEDSRAFGNKPVWKRMIIVVAGAIMNILLGFILMIITLSPSEYFASTQIAVFTDYATSSEQLMVGDRIKAINGYGINTSMDMSFALATAKSPSLDVDVIRNGERLSFTGVKLPTKTTEEGKDILMLDFKVQGVKNTFPTLISEAFFSTISTIKMVWTSLLGMVTGQFSLNEVSGPVGMTSAISKATAVGLESSFWDGLNNLIYVMTIITVNLGVVNLLPLPALDGGRLVFLILEAIRRKPVKPEHEGYVHAVGMLLLFAFMIIISIKDVIQLLT